MPKLDGLELLEQAEQHSGLVNLPIIIVTEPEREARLPANLVPRARGFVGKPFTIEKLLVATAAGGAFCQLGGGSAPSLTIHRLEEMIPPG